MGIDEDALTAAIVALARRQEFHSGFATKREAELELAKAAGAIANGTHIEASRLLVDDFLKKQWLPAIRPTVLT